MIEEFLGNMMNDQIIITGGTGYIGYSLAKFLVHNNYDVTLLSRQPEKYQSLSTDRIRIDKWNTTNDTDWAQKHDGCYSIINLAGASIGSGLWTKKYKERILTSRLNAGKAIIDAVKRMNNKPEVIIQASGIGYYGDAVDQIVDETFPNGSGYLANVAKQWEHSIQEAESLGVRLATIRMGVVIGKDSLFIKRILLPFRLFMGGHPGNGRQWISWIHIDDIVNAIIHLIQNKKAAGTYNLVSPKPVIAKEFYAIVGRSINRPSWFPITSSILKMVLGDMAIDLMLSGQRTSSQKLLETGFNFKYIDLEDALKTRK